MISYEKELSEIIALSRRYGTLVDHVQGAGGNTSIKFGRDKMLVKASGKLLKEMDTHVGWVIVDRQAIRDKITSIHSLAKDSNAGSVSTFNQSFDSSLVRLVDEVTTRGESSSTKASIEAGMHALFRQYAVHIHPVYLNTLLTAETSKTIVDDLYGDLSPHYIKLVPPGYYIAHEIESLLQSETSLSEVIFLESHGVIVHADTMSRLTSLLDEVLTRSETYVRRHVTAYKPFVESWPWEQELECPALFPDTIVFEQTARHITSLPPAKARGIIETFASSAYMRHCHRELNLTSRHIPQSIRDYILNMDREKYRQAEFK